MFSTRPLALTAAFATALAAFACSAFAATPATAPPQPRPPAAAQAPATAANVVTGTHRPMIPVYEGRDPAQIADTDALITQVIPLDYISGSDMLAMISALVNPDTPMAASNNFLVVTEASSVVKRIVQIVCYVDVRPPNNNIIVVVPVAPGSAAEAARQINAVFSSQGR